MADVAGDRRHSRTRLALLAAATAAARLSPRRLLRFGRPFSAPDRIVAAPPPVLPGNGAAGAAFYGGTFHLAGTGVDADGRSIFEIEPPNADWAQALHGFSWLSDLAAAGTGLARAHARALIDDWIALGRHRREVRRPEIAARRLLNWLTYAPDLLEDADPGFRRRFLRALARQAARLRRDGRRAEAGVPRVLCAIALTQAGLCLPDAGRHLSCGAARLANGLKSLVLPDGGPATRNPGDLLALALDLLPLRATYSERGLGAPRELEVALDRIIPMLRFFRHGDGSLALFNGMGPTPPEQLDAVLMIDDAQGKPVSNASFSGYQRLDGGASTLIADTGRPPPLELSRAAHAGTLSFELTAGASRIVVNCGAPAEGPAALRLAARKTAAHSTASVGDASSGRFVKARALKTLLGPLMRDGPRAVEMTREDQPDGSLIRASHDGYEARFGLIHERALKLGASGDRLDGFDVLRPVRPQAGADIAIAFHLHPDVRATALDDGSAVLLALPDGEFWLFAAENHTAVLEESVFFASPGGPRRSEQIVLRLGRRSGARVTWSFTRTGHETGQAPLALS